MRISALLLLLLLPAAGWSQEQQHPLYARIISLYPAHTENLVRLGALKQLVGIGRSDDYPQQVLQLPRFSYRDDAEKVLAARPDLVLIRPMVERAVPQFVRKLRAAGIAVVSLQPKGFDQLAPYWKKLGELSGHSDEAEKMVNEFTSRSRALSEAITAWRTARNLPKPKVYFEVMHSRFRTVAAGSIAAWVLATAGGDNIAEDATRVRTTNVALFPKEKLLSRGAQVDVYLAQKGRMNPVTKESIVKEPGYGALRAVREDRLFLLPEELVSRPTWRLLEGVQRVAEILYPGVKL